MNADEMTSLEKLEFLTKKAEQLARLFEHMRWMAQTVHQAYHQDQPSTFLVCTKEYCRSTAKILYEAVEPYERDA